MMKKMTQLWLLVVAFICSVQGMRAEVFPAYVYTEADKTLYLIKYDDATEPQPATWQGKNVSFFSRYSGSLSTLSATLKAAVEAVVVDPSLSGYKLTTAANLFHGLSKATSISGLQHLDLSEARYANGMFYNCSAVTTLDLSTFNTGNMTSMHEMFFGCKSLTALDVSSFNTENVTDMASMFHDCSSLTTLDVSQFNTAKVTNMRSMFSRCSGLTTLDVSTLNTANVTTMTHMFQHCSGLTTLDVSTFNTAKVTDMSSMFYLCSGLTALNVSNFNTAKVTNMSSMFSGCSKLTALDISDFVTDNVTNMYSMFYSCSGLTALDVSHFNTGKVTTMSTMFGNCKGLSTIDVSRFATGNVTTMAGMFQECTGLTSLDVSNFNTANVTDMNSMFRNCNKLPSLDVSRFNTGKVANMNSMFMHCSGLTSLDVSNFNTENVLLMNSMFRNCSKLSTIDVSNFRTSKVTNMTDLFHDCSAVTSLDVSNFDTQNITSMNNMFDNCSALTSLDVSNFNTAKVTSMNSVFANCSGLTTLNVSNFNTENVVSMYRLFYRCLKLPTLDISHFRTPMVTNMVELFAYCSALTSLDVSNFNTAKVTDMRSMFYGCTSFTAIDVSAFDLSNVTNMSSMFSDCIRLKTLTFLENWDGAAATNISLFDNLLARTVNLEYVDLSKAKNMSVEHQTRILRSIPDRLTLKYMPEGSTVTGPNVITNDGTNFTCIEYVVADDTLTRYTGADLLPNSTLNTRMKWEVNIPYAFMADKVTNTRKIGAKAGSAYTWFMPYSSPIPAGVEVYEFKEATVDGIVATFVRSTDTELKAQKPYLVKSTAGEVSTSVDATSEIPAYTPGNDVVAAETSDGWKFIGSLQWRTTEKAAEEGLHTLQTGNKWKHYEGSTAKPRPFRAYLKKAGSGARELSVNFEDGSGITGIEKIELLDGNTPENNSIYDLNGRYLGTRRDVLPTGTYIIGGKTTRI